MKNIFLVCLFTSLNLACALAQDVKGTIRDTEGRPISEVVVSDGFTVVQTDSQGSYSFQRNKEASYVYISLPAAYEIPLRHGAPCFYKKLTDDLVYDFVLKPLRKGPQNDFTVLFLADPQCQNIRHVNRFRTETVPDVKATVKKSKTPVFCVTLGDIGYSEGPRNAVYLLPIMKNEMSVEKTGAPVFQTIGNHDFEYQPCAESETNLTPTMRMQRTFEAVFGPLNYSWNRGQAHIISMNDVVYKEMNKPGKYVGDFLDYQVEWLKRDLSFVPKDKLILFCVHIPLEHNRKRANSQKVLELLSQFENCHIISGHTHYMRSFFHKNGIREHILAAVCGQWWWSRFNGDGCPNGYGVFSVKGNKLSDWYYKGVGFDRNSQFQLYRGDAKCGGVFEQPQFMLGEQVLLANVWNADKDWKIEVFEDGVKSGEMKKIKPTAYRAEEYPTTLSSKDWWAIGYHVGVVGRGHVGTSTRRNYCMPCYHMYRFDLRSSKSKVLVRVTDHKGRVFSENHVISGPEYKNAAAPKYEVTECW
ncbi:MAG: calcineurin-like phosphoesterase C-terminal domain-containing protein [Alistipes sp.]|nr:calcineurin-like phosphoesterase C-terminal domain-containing protein [Candidatus Alistipes equi]